MLGSAVGVFSITSFVLLSNVCVVKSPSSKSLGMFIELYDGMVVVPWGVDSIMRVLRLLGRNKSPEDLRLCDLPACWQLYSQNPNNDLTFLWALKVLNFTEEQAID